jgi:hypothetical protein
MVLGTKCLSSFVILGSELSMPASCSSSFQRLIQDDVDS